MLKRRTKRKKFEEKVVDPHTSVFTINKEDHTLGNLLQQCLCLMKCVKFAGYNVLNPLESTIKLRIGTDGSVTPKDVLVACMRKTIEDLEVL
ncbi:RBP11-like subunits of RNA polymerase [Corynespora cassiicola Philippines]|uniref:RBP11-like subunits of RNA polymerase n=1 Tax=Corynespora cassiicola Philippines TaxID=1448308 RepID=A0A2T2NSF4_CORCC|nr:RBP11-like subunits of RNA polymerase [Corynespora cassiicola Philippines]